MNSDDQKVRDAGRQRPRKKIVRACGPKSAIRHFRCAPCWKANTEIYMVSDASGGSTGGARPGHAAHDQAGVVSVTWRQVLLEWQRDWARRSTYDAVVALR